ncbi:hypothetical protein [Vibrio parahaemolyticus]|uniref:hypothetical protein n=1 Tax=Vibrio parahaemolyticus TaxID=670 RepID=UPI0006C6DFAD|nr:hypothetical protein ACX10_12155 [Vibrio parahaemolyticus]
MLYFVKSLLIRLHDEFNGDFPCRCAHDIYDSGYYSSFLKIKFSGAYPHHPYGINQHDSEKRKEYLIGLNALLANMKVNVGRDCFWNKYGIKKDIDVKRTLIEKGFKLNEKSGVFEYDSDINLYDSETLSYLKAYNEFEEYSKELHIRDHKHIEKKRVKFGLTPIKEWS